MARSLAEMNGSSITLHPVDAAAQVIFDSLSLGRVVDNLIKNALVHNPPSVHVEVSVQCCDTYHLVRVSDNGKGIAAEHLDKIFEPEYRVNAADNKGTGLGLSIVKTLIEETGGHISVASTVGVGTTFIIAVRAALPSEDPVAPPVARMAPPDPTGIVDSGTEQTAVAGSAGQ